MTICGIEWISKKNKQFARFKLNLWRLGKINAEVLQILMCTQKWSLKVAKCYENKEGNLLLVGGGQRTAYFFF